MELFRASEALLRAQSVLSFLAPSAYRVPPSRTFVSVARHQRPRRPQQCQRASLFSTSRAASQQASARRGDDAERTPSSQPRSNASELSALLETAFDFTKTAQNQAHDRAARYNDPPRQRTAPPSRPSSGTSIEDLLATDFSRPPHGTRANEAIDFTNIADAIDPLRNTSRAPASRSPPVLEEAPMKLGPSVGRTIEVKKERGMDVGRAFRALDIACARNAVRRDFKRQRFHERPGLKRKRLRSERWRRRFKEGFRGVVKMVGRMRSQGW